MELLKEKGIQLEAKSNSPNEKDPSALKRSRKGEQGTDLKNTKWR